MTDFPKTRDQAAEAYYNSDDRQCEPRGDFCSGANWAYQLFWMELIAKRQEIDRLKASLRLLEEECDRKDAEFERLKAQHAYAMDEGDAWRERCEKLAEALKKLHEYALQGSNKISIEASRVANEALRAFEKWSKGK